MAVLYSISGMTTPSGLLVILVLLGAGAVGLVSFLRSARRKKVLAKPFPNEWAEIIRNNLPPYAKLPQNLRDQLNNYIKIFLSEKDFEGCGGIDVDDEIKVTIAAQACMLLLNRKSQCYPRLRSIIIYPSTYVAGKKGLFTQETDKSVRLGESWNTGVIVLAWDSVRKGAINFEDGHNVTLHEFAHQLDQEDGLADGAPKLGPRSAYSLWASVLSKEYEVLKRKKAKGRKTLMDKYGATNPAEFFAVATETFFEKPEQLKEKHPELYDELHSFYNVYPEEWK
jgi:Mlc titration factor MtfA (ptsG expression regulator)